jgi:pilus assembly protein Flp/PilA
MVEVINYLKKRYLTERAQGVVEYALVIAFVIVAATALGTSGGLGDKIAKVFTDLSTKFGS